MALSLLCLSASAATAISLEYKISGIQDAALKNAKARLQIAQKSIKGALTKQDITQLYQDSPNQIKKAIEPYGYFRASVSSSLSHQRNSWTANYSVKSGIRLHITRLSIRITGTGKNNKRINKFIKNFPIKASQPFNSEKYEKAKNKLLLITQKQGYLRAKFVNSQAIIYLNNYTCLIKINLETGPRFYYGNVTFSSSPLNDAFLRRYINFKKGKPFSYQRLLNFQQILSGASYFDDVSVVPLEKKTKNQEVPVHVNLKMRKRKQYRFGVGYGSNSGARGTIGYNLNWVNQYGHKFNALMQLSTINSTLATQYLIPGKKPAHEHYAINGAIFQLRPKRGRSLVKSVGVAKIRTYNIWQQTLALTFERERYKLNDSSPNQTSKLLFPSITISHTKSNNVLQTKNGYNATIKLLGTSRHVVSTVSLAQLRIDYTQIFTLLHNNRFVLRGAYGYDLVHDMKRRLPLSKYFYTGGINSVRGYRFQGLGPGRFLIVGSAEYQRRVYGNWYAAVFYDIGNAINHFKNHLDRGTGVGIVWLSPIGALRFYVARALDRRNKPIDFEFSFGPEL